MSLTEEGWLDLPDGKKLYTKTWKTEGPAKARLVFVHGFSDHINTYYNLFPTLVSRGIEVYGFDQRGWGRSALDKSEWGNSGPTSQVLADITAFIKSVLPSPVPLFLMGHSMGGGEVLCYAAQGPAEIRQHIRGYLLESPFVDFDSKSKPSAITVFGAKLVEKVFPLRQRYSKLDAKLICRDSAICAQFDKDPLCHDTGTFQALAALMDRTNELSDGKVMIPDDAGHESVTRIWMAHGDADGICSYAASKAFSERQKITDLTFKTYPGHFHRIHDDPDPNKTFAHDTADWILARLGEPVQGVDEERSKL